MIIVQTKVVRLDFFFSFNWTEEGQWDKTRLAPDSFGFILDLPGLALKVPCFRKALSPRQNEGVSHPRIVFLLLF